MILRPDAAAGTGYEDSLEDFCSLGCAGTHGEVRSEQLHIGSS